MFLLNIYYIIMDLNIIHDILYNQIKKQIYADLTIGRTDNDKKAYSPKKINEYIEKNKSNIEKTIEDIICDFEEDNELDELIDLEDSVIREYLYDYIKY